MKRRWSWLAAVLLVIAAWSFVGKSSLGQTPPMMTTEDGHSLVVPVDVTMVDGARPHNPDAVPRAPSSAPAKPSEVVGQTYDHRAVRAPVLPAVVASTHPSQAALGTEVSAASRGQVVHDAPARRLAPDGATQPTPTHIHQGTGGSGRGLLDTPFVHLPVASSRSPG